MTDSTAEFLAVVLFFFGISFGSFINVVALRLPPILFYRWRLQCREFTGTGIKPDSAHDQVPPGLVFSSSRCPTCRQPLRALHNIPLLSFLFLRGKCGFCQTSISLRYPLVELITAQLWVLSGYVFGPGWPLLFSLVLISCLITLALIDLDHQLLPDSIVLPLLWMGLAANTVSIFTTLDSAVIAAIAGYLVLWTIYQIHYRITGKQGMGYGDFKLLACLGAWLGWEMLPITVLIASATGTLITFFFIFINRQDMDAPVAFGPFLIVGGLCALFWGEAINTRYLSWLVF